MKLSLFAHFLVLGLTVAVLTTTASALSTEPPKISITLDNGVSTSAFTLSTHDGRRHVLPKPSPSTIVTIRCQAKYSVMWRDIDAVVQQGIIGAESERMVDLDHFGNPETYKYTMSLKWKVPGGNQTEKYQFLCLAVPIEGNGTSTSLSTGGGGFDRDTTTLLTIELGMFHNLKFQSIVFSMSSPTIMPGSNSAFDVSLIPSDDGHFMNVTCCLRPGVYPNLRQHDIRIGHGQCSEPLLCIKKNTTLMEARRGREIAKYSRCHSELAFITQSDRAPAVVACGLKGGAIDGWADFDVNPSHLEFLSSLQSKSLLGDAKTTEWMRVTNTSIRTPFYTGDIVLFRCEASSIYYAQGIIWEMRFKNGTHQLVYTFETVNETLNSAEFPVLLTDDLVLISCHLPPWKTSAWVTHSVNLDINAPLPGTTFNQESITFYTHESPVLRCEFGWQPSPKIEWNTDSRIYQSLHLHESTLIVWTNSMDKLPTSLSQTSRLPPEVFSCTATDATGGNETKIFYIQAIRSFKPILTNPAREAVVLYAGDRDTGLNCSLLQGIPVTFLWQLHGKNISGTDNELFEIQTVGIWSALKFKTVRPEDEAEYSCSATNTLGSVVKEFSVRIRERTTHWNGLSIPLLVIALVLTVSVAFIYYFWTRKNKKIVGSQSSAEFTKSGPDEGFGKTEFELITF